MHLLIRIHSLLQHTVNVCHNLHRKSLMIWCYSNQSPVEKQHMIFIQLKYIKQNFQPFTERLWLIWWESRRNTHTSFKNQFKLHKAMILFFMLSIVLRSFFFSVFDLFCFVLFVCFWLKGIYDYAGEASLWNKNPTHLFTQSKNTFVEFAWFLFVRLVQWSDCDWREYRPMCWYCLTFSSNIQIYTKVQFERNAEHS